MPTLDEINAAAPETPVFILHLYCRACGYTKDTPNPPGGEIQRDHQGNPTGLLIARPNATILYATLAKGPKLPPEHQYNPRRCGHRCDARRQLCPYAFTLRTKTLL